jgi:uncharacterized phosphosugar-binding protein
LENHSSLKGIRGYWQAIADLQREVIETQSSILDKVAAYMVRVIEQSGRLFLFGTGHSHMLAEEGHFRAGSLANFIPILLSSIMLHEGSLLSGRIERTPGLAEPLLDKYAPQAGDMLFIFSNSGVNQMPVEMAVAAKSRGLMVVSLSSLAYAQTAPLNSLGKRLHEVADFPIDNRILPGDALMSLEGLPWRVAPASTVIGALVINCLVAEVAFRLHEREGIVPVFASANMPGAADHNEHLLMHWSKLNPHI